MEHPNSTAVDIWFPHITNVSSRDRPYQLEGLLRLSKVIRLTQELVRVLGATRNEKLVTICTKLYKVKKRKSQLGNPIHARYNESRYHLEGS